MTRCSNCRRDIPYKANHCPYCGAHLCGKCGQTLPLEVESCPYCGAEIAPRSREKFVRQTGRLLKEQHVSNSWYLLPVILGVVALFMTWYTNFSGPYIFLVPIHSTYGFIGGLIAYYLNKKKDPQKSQRFIIVGALTLMLVGFTAFWNLVATA